MRDKDDARHAERAYESPGVQGSTLAPGLGLQKLSN